MTPIRRFREIRGLRREDLARMVGRSTRTIIRWELGDTIPGSADLLRLASILGVPPAHLLMPLKNSVGRARRPAR